jgi:Na+-driven multidrug efflux pump
VVLIDVLSKPVFALFLPPDSVALKIGVHLNHISVWSYALFGISLVLLGVVRANGAVIAPLIILAVSLLGVRFPLALALLDGLHADAIWWSFPLSSAFSVVLAVLYYKYGRWRGARMIPDWPASASAPGTGALSCSR